MTTKDIIIREINKELSARRGLWPAADKANAKFISRHHQDRYDIMNLTKCIISAMTPAEVAAFKKRYQDKKTATGEQKSLF